MQYFRLKTLIKKFIRILSLFFIVVAIVATILVVLWFKYAISSKEPESVALQDLRLATHLSPTCEQIPSLSRVNDTFVSNKSNLSALLQELSSCGNNIFVCDKYSKCIEENYDKHIIRSGYTIIKWVKVQGCGDQEKGAIHISYSSACEVGVLGHFMGENQDFNLIPAEYNNY